MYFVFQDKYKYLLDVYQYGCDPFCMSLLPDRHLKVCCNTDLFRFFNKTAFTSARDS